MNKKNRRIICLFLSIIFITMSSVTAFAAKDAEVVYNGNDQKMVMTQGDDLFLNFKELMPGDQTEQIIKITNNSEEAFRLRLSAQVTQNKELLDELILMVSSKRSGTSESTTLYQGAASGWKVNADGSSYIDLGAYTSGYQGELKVTLSIPEDLRNGYAGKVAKIKWIFSLEKATIEGTSTNNTVRQPTILGSIVKLVATGDNAPVVWLIVAMIISTCICTFIITKRNKVHSKNGM